VTAPPSASAVAGMGGTGTMPIAPSPTPIADGVAGAPATPSSGMPISGMTATAGAGAGDMMPPAKEDQGMGDGSDVVTIGDSYMQLGNEGIEPSLDKAAGQTYRHYGVMGTQLTSGQIPQQYDQAKSENPKILTVLMTGGGNDFLQNPSNSSDCADVGPNCSATVEKIVATLTMLWAKMGADGVKDVFMITYPHTPMMNLNPASDAALPKQQKACDEATPIHCHLLNSVPLFMGRETELIRGDNIHPTAEGYQMLAESAFKALVDTGARR
jgi:lysophospholipase L1-like esterase